METGRLQLYKRISFSYLIVMVIIISLVFLIAYVNKNSTSANPFIYWTINYSFPITISVILISVGLGYFLASLTYSELRKTKQESKSLLELLFLFLNSEEQEIINHLVTSKGESTQSDISRLPNMNRVKAFRAVQKMVEKNLIDVVVFGKVRKVKLKENVFNLLSE